MDNTAPIIFYSKMKTLIKISSVKTLIIIVCFILIFVLIAPIGIANIQELYTKEITEEVLITNITVGSTDLNTFFIPPGEIINSSLTFTVQVNPILDAAFFVIFINDDPVFSGVGRSGQKHIINYNAINGDNSFRVSIGATTPNFTSMDLFLKHEATVARPDKITRLLSILQFFIVIVGVLFIARIFKSMEL